MAAKMAEMRRAAELEVEADDDEEEEDRAELTDLIPSSGTHFEYRRSGAGTSAIPRVANPPNGLEADTDLLKLRFVSTRQMGPPRSPVRVSDPAGSPFSQGTISRRSGESLANVFDILDKGLEGCQSQCEHAAHQFLREGDCSTEVENIKKNLLEVKQTAEKEMERLRQEEAAILTAPKRAGAQSLKGRELKSVQMRRDIGALKDLEVDNSLDMEVDDDEGVDDLEQPTLVFKRSRDI